MPTILGTSVEDLKDAIKEEAHSYAVLLVNLWEEMGLSEEEVKERVQIVASKVPKVMESMVTSDTKNRDKLMRRCKEQQVQVDALSQELEAGGIKVESKVAMMTSLVMHNRDLHDQLHELEMMKEKHMVQIRTLLDKEGSLAKTLGVKSLEVNSRRLPDAATLKRLEKQVEELTRLSEEREEEMFAIKEEVVHLLDVLDLDLNTTSIEEMLIVNQEQFDSLRSKDVEAARQTLNSLRQKVEVKKKEVASLLDKLMVLYDCLVVPLERRSRLCIPEAFSLEELCKVDKVAAIREEVAQLQAVRKENMAEILGRVREELEASWRCRMVGAWTQQMFWRNSVEDPEEELQRIQREVHNIQEDLDKHEETLNKVNTFLERCRLAQELSIRQQDPARLKNRGNALMQEEKDRKKVNALPSLKEELLMRVERWGDIMIQDKRLSELIGSECSFLEKIYETSLSTSSTRPPAKSNRVMSRTAAAVPSSSRPFTRANSTLGLGSSGSLANGGTPSSSSLRAPSSSKVYGTRNRTRMVGGESPLRRPSSVKTPSLRVQESSIIATEASLLLSESIFTESVPLSSTIQDPSADAAATSIKKVWADRARVELIANQVHADQARLEKSTASLQRAKEIAAFANSRLPQPPVAKRKLRRSNSCSDLRTNHKSTKVGMLGGRNAPALVEEQVEARGRGREEMRPVSSRRLVRAVSSTKLFVR